MDDDSSESVSGLTRLAWRLYLRSMKKPYPSARLLNSSAPVHPSRRFRFAACLAAFFFSVIASGLPAASFTGDRSLLESDATVIVQKIGKDISFLPAVPDTSRSRPGFAFYPGAKVPPEAYAWLAHGLAAAGYQSFILKVPFNFAILDTNAARRIIAAHPETSRWVFAGHSLGGVAAAMFAKANPLRTAGLVFLASYPSGSTNLAAAGFPVSSISASNDLLATPQKIAAAKKLLPSDTTYSVIDGGNHAGFGDYGPQNGDGVSTISPQAQKAATLAEVLRLLDSIQ